MSIEMNAANKLDIALSLLTEEQMHEYDKQTDCSCPNCGASDFDGYCSWCKYKGKSEDGINWYTDDKTCGKSDYYCNECPDKDICKNEVTE